MNIYQLKNAVSALQLLKDAAIILGAILLIITAIITYYKEKNEERAGVKLHLRRRSINYPWFLAVLVVFGIIPSVVTYVVDQRIENYREKIAELNGRSAIIAQIKKDSANLRNAHSAIVEDTERWLYNYNVADTFKAFIDADVTAKGILAIIRSTENNTYREEFTYINKIWKTFENDCKTIRNDANGYGKIPKSVIVNRFIDAVVRFRSKSGNAFTDPYGKMDSLNQPLHN
jgi:hypothetical protein